MQRRGLRVALVGDFNIALGEGDVHPRLKTEYPHGLARAEFTETFMPGLDVADVFREKVPGQEGVQLVREGEAARCGLREGALRVGRGVWWRTWWIWLTWKIPRRELTATTLCSDLR